MSPRRARPLSELEPSTPSWTVAHRLDRLETLCARWGFEVTVVHRSHRCTLLEVSAYGRRYRMALREAEFAVGAWVEAEIAEAAAHRVRAGYPPTPVGSS